MTTKITIDPTLVREVLGIEDNIEPIKVEIDDNRLCYSYADGSSYGCTWGNINIYEFVHLAIEWCARRRYIVERIAGFVLVKIDWKYLKILTYGGSQPDYSDMLSAELAAIDFCWKQIQKEKKDEYH